MALPLYVSLEQIDARLLEAAEDLYAIVAARILEGDASAVGYRGSSAGTLLTFIPAAGDFINAALLGTPNQAMIGNVIQSKFLESLDYPSAASLSFILMGLILVCPAPLRPSRRHGAADGMTTVAATPARSRPGRRLSAPGRSSSTMR